jgi:hypothetical protein
MSSESQPTGLLADYLRAAREEGDAWQALSHCQRRIADCTDEFRRWKQASEASRRIAARWQAAIGSRGRCPPE